MAQVDPQWDRAGLVVGLCPDTAVYLKLARVANASGLASSSVRAAGTIAAVHAVEDGLAHAESAVAKAWHDRVVPLNQFEHEPYFAVADEPLLKACFSCLSNIPAGGAPWQGSWRGDKLSEVLRALEEGAILLAVEAHSLEEQRSWARTLLKSGCAFVQTHEDAHCPHGAHGSSPMENGHHLT